MILVWKKIDSRIDKDGLAVWEPLRIKLATRFLKANLHRHAVAHDSTTFQAEYVCGAINAPSTFGEDYAKICEGIDEYAACQDVSSSDIKIKELATSRKEWKQVRNSSNRCQERALAQKRFRALPIFKWPALVFLRFFSCSYEG